MIVHYINSKGKTKVRGFENKDEALKFIKILDKRIEKGTCGGYIATNI